MRLRTIAEIDRAHRPGRHVRRPSVGGLEARLVLNAHFSVQHTLNLAAQRAHHQSGRFHGHPTRISARSRQITNSTTGTAMQKRPGSAVAMTTEGSKSTFTNASGNYQFQVTKNSRTSSTRWEDLGCADIANIRQRGPVGCVRTASAGSGSWNSPPAPTLKGRLAPMPGTIAPAGDERFQSPINLHGRTIDLRSVLGINYNNAVPSDIINNSHQIQVQFPALPSQVATRSRLTGVSNSAFHYHDPAENTVNDHRYNMEALSTSTQRRAPEASWRLPEGGRLTTMQPIRSSTRPPRTLQPNSTTTTARRFSWSPADEHQGWFYRGSLTTPPLSRRRSTGLCSRPRHARCPPVVSLPRLWPRV